MPLTVILAGVLSKVDRGDYCIAQVLCIVPLIYSSPGLGAISELLTRFMPALGCISPSFSNHLGRYIGEIVHLLGSYLVYCTGITIGKGEYPQMPIYALVLPGKMHSSLYSFSGQESKAIGAVLLAAVAGKEIYIMAHPYNGACTIQKHFFLLIGMYTALFSSLYKGGRSGIRSSQGGVQLGNIIIGYTYRQIIIRPGAASPGDLYAAALLAIAALVGAHYHAL